MNTNTYRTYGYQTVLVILLILISLLCLLPFVTLLAKSLSEEAYVVSGQVVFLPIEWNTKAYELVLLSNRFLDAFRINVIVTVVGTASSVLLTTFAAYTLSRKYLPGRRSLTFLFIFTMLFSGGIIPTYLVVKELGLINSIGSLILPAMITPFNLILIKSYFETLPDSLEESAKIDGASNLHVMFRIMIPLALPSIATITIFYAVGYWNEYFSGLIYINKTSLQPLQVYLRDMLLNMDVMDLADPSLATEVAKESVRGATIIVSILPIVIVYPFLQKYFVKGTIVGAVKE